MFRVACALVLVIGLSACESTHDVAPERPDTVSERLSVVADFRVPSFSGERSLRSVSAPEIAAGRRATAIIAIQRPRVDARCLVAAQLRLYITHATEAAADGLAIYPSHVFDATSKRNGDAFGYAGTLLDIRPRAVADELVEGGWSHWDITDIVRLWLKGGPFPSQGAPVPGTGPVVLSLRDKEGPYERSSFTSIEGRTDRRPHVVLTHRCLKTHA